MRNTTLAPAGMALAAAALWGTTGTAQSLAPAQTSPYAVGALRLAIASLFFAGFMAWRRIGAALPRHAWGGVALAGVCVAAYNLSFFAGVRATGVALGTVVAIGSGPVWAGVLQWGIARQPPPAAWWLGTALAVGGVALMLPGSGDGARVDAAGLALCLVAGLSYAGYTLASQRLVARMAPSVITLWSFAVAAMLALPAAAAAGGMPASPAGWWVVAYLGVFATGVAYLLFSHALRHLSAPTGVSLALGEPVAAFVLAIAVVGEQPQPLAFAGLALVLAGLVLVVLRGA